MAISTYAELLTAARDWMLGNTTTLPDSAIANTVILAEAEIYGRLRVRAMETTGDLTFSTHSAALPTGYVGARRLYIDGTPLLIPVFKTPEQFWGLRRANTAGQPKWFTVEGANILIGPAPDATYTGKFLYYARPAALSGALNAIFTDNPDLFLYGTLAHLAPYAIDAERAQLWRGMFEQAIDRVVKVDERDRFAGTPLTIGLG